MSEQIILSVPVIFQISFEIVVLPVTGLRLPVVHISRKETFNDFVPDRRIFTFRLLGKPSSGQSPP
jgi:hypothetical protein